MLNAYTSGSTQWANNSRVLVIAAGLVLALLGWIGTFSAGVPTVYCPMPTLTILPAFVLSLWNLQTVAVVVPVILFFVWTPGLIRRGQSNLPKRTIGLVALLTVLTAVDFSLEWQNGIRFRGLQHTIAVYVINAVSLALIWLAMLRAWRKPSFRANLCAHWLLFAWLAWYAFPYLGELP